MSWHNEQTELSEVSVMSWEALTANPRGCCCNFALIFTAEITNAVKDEPNLEDKFDIRPEADFRKKQRPYV